MRTLFLILTSPIWFIPWVLYQILTAPTHKPPKDKGGSGSHGPWLG